MQASSRRSSSYGGQGTSNKACLPGVALCEDRPQTSGLKGQIREVSLIYLSTLKTQILALSLKELQILKQLS